MTEVNKTTSQDVIYATTRAALGSIPLIGAAASELLGLIVTPPLEKRREEWMTEVGEKLKELQEAGKLDIESLSDNQQFIDTVLQATTYALKTSDREKIARFKNAVINTALGDTPDETRTQIFLSLIDNFTTLHIKLLHLFDDPIKWFEQNSISIPNYLSASLLSIVRQAYPTLKGQDELLDLVWSDLARAGLHNTSELKTMMTGNGLLANRTTDLGKQFLDFISRDDD